MPYITLFVLLCGALGRLIGLGRGARRKISGISAIILSVATALIVTPIIVKTVFTDSIIMSLMDMMGFSSQYNDLVQASPSVADLVRGIPVALIAPILFLFVYLILRLIFRIIAGIVTKAIFKEKNWLKSKVWGLSLGFLQGVMSAIVFVAIIAGLVCTVNNVTDTILAQDSDQLAEIQETVSEIDGYVNIVADDPIVKIVDKTNFIYNSLNSFKFNGETVVLKNELATLTDAGVYLLPLSENTDIATWTSTEYDMLDTFVDKFGASEILPVVSSDILSAACESWANGETFMGIEAPKADETINPLLITLYASFKTSDPNTIVTDLGTLVDILRITGKYELLAGESTDIMSKLSGDLITELLNVISQNERFSILIPEITNLSMRMLASAIKLPANTEEVYGNITSSISNDLNSFLSGTKDAEACEQLKTSVTTALKDNGIEVSDDVATIVAETIITAFEEKETVSQEDIENYFADYAKIYEAVEGKETNTASAKDFINLEVSSGAAKTSSVYDYKTMSFDEKIAALATIGVLDEYQTAFDLSSAYSTLPNGMTADQFVNYLLSIYNSIVNSYEQIKSLGGAETNPLISLKSAETIQTTKMTAADLLVDSDNYTLTENDIENIAQGFESISTFIDSYSKLEGDVSLDNLADLDLEAAGKALDLLQNTELLGDKVGAVADALIGEMTGADISISETMQNNNASFESLMTTVKSTSTVIGNLSNSDLSDEESQAAFLDLLLNLTPETSDVISEIVTVDFMTQFGIPKEYAAVSANALKVALVEMAHLPETEHDVEAAKLKQLFELASSAGTSDKTMIGDNGIFKTENDVIDMIVKSTVAYKTIVAISSEEGGSIKADALGLASSMDAESKVSLSNALVNYYNANKTSSSVTDLAERLNAISTLFNLGVTIK